MEGSTSWTHESTDYSEFLAANSPSAFVTRIIHESSQVQHAANSISVTLAANIDLVAGVEISISGLITSTQYKTGAMILNGRSAGLFAGRQADFES